MDGDGKFYIIFKIISKLYTEGCDDYPRDTYLTCELIHLIMTIKVTLGVSPQFFSIWTQVLNHNKYVEIKQFSKVDIKQNNISTVILLIKFLVYQ